LQPPKKIYDIEDHKLLVLDVQMVGSHEKLPRAFKHLVNKPNLASQRSSRGQLSRSRSRSGSPLHDGRSGARALRQGRRGRGRGWNAAAAASSSGQSHIDRFVRMVPFEVPSAHSQGSSSEIGADFGASASARCEVQAPAIQLDSDEDDDDIAMAAACFAA
jgi:hypothetical protein